jgi:hypothetical protein
MVVKPQVKGIENLSMYKGIKNLHSRGMENLSILMGSFIHKLVISKHAIFNQIAKIVLGWHHICQGVFTL